MAPAELGNFLVRERVRQILEIAAPGECSFYQTQDLKTRQPTPWLLTVPKQLLPTGTVKQSIKRCPDCGEPGSAHGTQYEARYQVSSAPFDLFRSLNWISIAEKAPDYSQKWVRDHVDHRHVLHLTRELYFSVRLETLLNKLAVRGMCRSVVFSVKPTADDLAWVQEKLRLLQNLLAELSSTDATGNLELWFEDYLKKKGKKHKTFDFDAVERGREINLPSDYKRFIAKVGSKTFRNVDGEEGFNVRILPPEELDFDHFRNWLAKDTKNTAEERIEAAIFGTTEHGDLLCFDVTSSNGEYAVYLYDHELDDCEPYTSNFAACIKRLARA
jgi:hypothetical protein